jgi:hypothetical protein
MFRRVALVRTDVSEELSGSFIRMKRIGELRKTLALTNNRRTLRRNTSVPTRATWRNIPEDAILHSHRRENFKSHTVSNAFWTARNSVNSLQSLLLGTVTVLSHHTMPGSYRWVICVFKMAERVTLLEFYDRLNETQGLEKREALLLVWWT